MIGMVSDVSLIVFSNGAKGLIVALMFFFSIGGGVFAPFRTIDYISYFL